MDLRHLPNQLRHEQEVASFGIGITIIEPGGTKFRYDGAPVAKLMPSYDQTTAHSFLRMHDPKNSPLQGVSSRGVTSAVSPYQHDHLSKQIIQ
jgi:hypothetical protein